MTARLLTLPARRLPTRRPSNGTPRYAVLGLFAFLLAAVPGLAQAPTPVAIRETFKPGYTYHVKCNVNITGELVLPAEKGQGQPTRLPVTGRSVIRYDERILAMQGANVDRTVRFYGQMDFERQAGKNDQRGSLRKEVRRLVILRHKQYEVPFCPAGPLLWEELDMVRTDVFTPALNGLLPTGKVRPGDSWAADVTAVAELTDLERITAGSLTCVFEKVMRPATGAGYARIGLRGKIQGIGEDGPASHEIEGFLLFDLSSNHLSYLSMQGTQRMLDAAGRPSGGRIEGTFVLTREAAPAGPELSDAALRGLKLEPTDANTQLWFVSPEVGVSFLYPRHWHIAGVNSTKRQVGLDEKRGSGILITADAIQNIPAVDRFQQEVKTDLLRQKLAVRKMEAPRTFAPGIDTFGVEAQAGGKSVTLQYFLIRQKDRGAVLTANLTATDLRAMQADVARLVRSLVVLAPTK